MTAIANPALPSRSNRLSFIQRWYPASPWQTNAALLIFGFGLILLSRHLVLEYHHYTIGYSGTSGLSAMLYIASVFLVLTRPVNRLTLPIIIAVAITCRIVPLFAEPHLSTDIYRYVWDGIVQHARISPYRYVPGDPALAILRDQHDQIFNHINRRSYAHTIYPPAAQALFYLITAISPTILAMKTAMVLFEGVTLCALIAILRALGLRIEQSLLYAWCPMLIWEFAGAGHLDSTAMAYIALALLFRLKRRAVLTGVFLGLAIITKFYPIVLLPPLMMPREPLATTGRFAYLNLRNWNWSVPIATLSVVVLGYAIYSSAGWLMLGFLNGYAQEEGINSGTRYFLLKLAHNIPGFHDLSIAAFYLFCIAVFVALKIWALRRNLEAQSLSGREAAFIAPAFAFAVTLMFLFSPHYAWYIAWLVPFFTLEPNLPILVYLMAFFYLFTTPLGDGTFANMYILNKILYSSVAIACLIQFALRDRLPGLNFHQRRS